MTSIGIILNPKNNKLDIFSDVNHGDQLLDDWKSISRGAYYLGDSLVHWMCQKQHTLVHSSADSELIGASNVVCKEIWLLCLGEILGTKGPLWIYMDNKAAHNIVESKGFTKRVKHLEICDAYIHILIERGIVTILQVGLDNNCVDILTKVFGSPVAFVNAQENLFSPLRSESVGVLW
jgi:hypothetical protein